MDEWSSTTSGEAGSRGHTADGGRGRAGGEAIGLRLALNGMDLTGLELDLPSAAGGHQARLRGVKGLRGALEQGPGSVRLDGLEVSVVDLDMLRLAFGSVVIAEEGDARLEEVAGSFAQRDDTFDLVLEAARVRTTRLCIDVGEIHLEGAASMSRLRIRSSATGGCVQAEQVAIDTLLVRSGGLTVRADGVSGAHFADRDHSGRAVVIMPIGHRDHCRSGATLVVGRGFSASRSP
ncbi:MAG: hypothetical protein M3Y87_23910, partial [Myxococcota bacterium]|nr:hypothetical protein [Myxococcota bacterium]